MSYRNLSNNNSVTNIYLVANEIEISPSCIVHPVITSYYETKRFRHLDGSPNVEDGYPLESGKWKDPDTNTAPLIIPALNSTSVGASYNVQTFVNNVQSYFEIFDINVQIANSLPNTWPLEGPGDRYVKLLPPDLFISGRFWNALPPKFYPFKRLMWWHKKATDPGDTSIEDIFKGAVVDCAFPWINFAIIGWATPGNFNNLLSDTVHEIGHLYNLQHQGDRRDDPDLINVGLSYYGQSRFDEWAPIMGKSNDRLIQQWSNTEYKHAVSNPGRPYWVNEFRAMLEGGAKLKKLPNLNFKGSSPGPLNFGAPPSKRKKPVLKDYLYARYPVKSDNKEMTGMIGFDKDYDIIKLLLPKGSTTIKVQSDSSSASSMFIPRLEILYCQADREYDKSSIGSDEYTDAWTQDGNVNNMKNKNIFHKVSIENDEDKNVKQVGVTYLDSSNLNTASLVLTTEYTTLVYIKILGQWGDPIDDITKKPTQDDIGYSNYGSVGKYKLTYSTDALIDISQTIPYGRFEKFSICKDGQTTEKWLLIQDEDDNSQGDPSKKNIWSLELDIIENGQTKKKKFIVFGEPKESDHEEEDGKFYLTVLIDDECKKQEFILGMPRPEEEEG